LLSSTNARGIRSETGFAAAGGLTPRTYNTANLVQSHKEGLGLRNNYGFSYQYTADNAGNLAVETDPENGLRRNTWSSTPAINLHTLDQTVSPAGISESFTHTATGHVATQNVATLPAVSMSYDTAGLLASRVDGRNVTSRFSYDSHGNLTRTETASVVETKTYDNLGRVQTETDSLGNVTQYSYDAAGNMLEVLAPLNRKTVYTYDANGNKASMTDARGNTTRYTYNARNELVKTTATVAGIAVVTTYTYDELGRLQAVTNPNAHRNTTTFNATGKTLSETDALSNSTTFEYDEDDRVTQQTDPDGRVTTTAYDKLGRVTSVTTSAGTQRYTYDADGRMKTAIDRDGKTTTYGYDDAGRLTTVTEPNGAVTRAGYDPNGNQTSITDSRGQTTAFTYDSLNRRTVTTDPNRQQWVTTYDNNGNVKTETAPGNLVTTYTYDAANRQNGITYPDGSRVTFTFDGNDNRASMTDSTGTTRYEYDELNRLSKVIDPQGKAVTYAYDGVGNLKTLGYPHGKTVSYAYDQGERLTSLTDWLGKTTTYTLNKSGQVTLAALGNGSRAEMAYDSAGRLQSLVNKRPNGTVISSHNLTLDGRGNITNAATQLPLQPSLSNETRSMTYDNANRLASFKGATVNHDAAGRITGLAGNTYAYNGRDLITAISGAQTASFDYNGEGHRVSRTVNGQTTRYVIDPNAALPNVLAETDNAGNVLRGYVYGYGLVEQLDAANAARYYHFDPTGHTLALTDGSGAITDTYAYTPFGETTATGSTPNPFRYVGKEGVIDDGNGLHYMRARYYRADIARFMSLDAIEGTAAEPQGLNRYAYVRGNPITNIDPSGKCPQCLLVYLLSAEGIALVGELTIVAASIYFDVPILEGRGGLSMSVKSTTQGVKAAAGFVEDARNVKFTTQGEKVYLQRLQLIKSHTAGKTKELVLAQYLESEGHVVIGMNVYAKTPGGTRYYDVFYIDKNTKNFTNGEAKLNSAVRDANQIRKDESAANGYSYISIKPKNTWGTPFAGNKQLHFGIDTVEWRFENGSLVPKKAR
jgi:RHS repeat-associated protein